MRLALVRKVRGGRAGAVLVAALALSGCSSGVDSTPAMTSRFTSLFGSGGGAQSANAQAISPAQTQAQAPAATMKDEDCPAVDIRGGAGTLSVAARNDQPTASDLRYQLTFNALARQCSLVGQSVHMKVGVQGRVVVGPAGAPAEVGVPLRYAIVREGVEPRTIMTKFKRLPVALPPGTPNVLFTDVEEDISFPMPSRDEIQAYVLYVGFDDTGDRNERRPPAAKKAAPKRAQ
jgi:hypothetical protein